MHYLHLILVRAKNAKEAVQEAESAIDPYGDGDVFDYYEEVETWEADMPSGPISLLQNKDGFRGALAHARGYQRGALATTLLFLMPKPGLPLDPVLVGQRAGAVFENMVRSLMQRQMPSDNVMQAIMADTPVDPGLVNYAMRRALNLTAGHYTSDSHFFDATRFNTVIMSDDEVERAFEEKENLWIVPMDLHN